ncbi:MAG: NTP transferase domain-containing protein [Candidatus Eisenbacteria bacterium]|nr:NTP transferase domain-containing protein [Candidatus Latescibacterota bacterium]MBD3301107.1 NTP transferase domain-containing protein [Candidatus Eisenbacteria bacterium]
MRIHAVILAGGRGERFWPLSRRRRPKQLLPLVGKRSLLQETLARMEGWIDPERIWLVASGPLLAEIDRHLDGAVPPARWIEEPIPRNTAPAVGAAAAMIAAIDPGAFLLVLPSDHWIPDVARFREDVGRALRAAEEVGGLHLFGIPVTRPETGYGYVEMADELPEHPWVARVRRFHEKPTPRRALDYADRPEMLWNSGIFLWRAETILDALRQHVPASRDRIDRLREALRTEKRFGPAAKEALRAYLEGSDSSSIDYAVLEKHEETYVTRAGFRWSDLGSWVSWGERSEADPSGNRGKGPLLARDARNCIYYSENGALALLGVEDLIVVRVEDVTLVCARERAQEIRRILADARERGDMEEHL